MPPTAAHMPPAAQAEHAALIVAFDAGDLSAAERERAATLLAACDGCAELLADLATIRVAVAALPVPRRIRDFRLSDADAARCRPSLRNRLLGWLAAPRSGARPLAGGLAALGVAGLILTASPGIIMGSATSAPNAAASAGAADSATPETVRMTGPAATAAPALGREPVAQPQPAAAASTAPAAVSPEHVQGGDPPLACSAPLATTGADGLPTDGSCSVTKNGTDPERNTGGAEGTDASPAGAAAVSGTASEAPASSADVGVYSAAQASPAAAEPASDEGLTADAIATPQPDRTLPLVLSLALLASGVLVFGLRLGARRALH